MGELFSIGHHEHDRIFISKGDAMIQIKQFAAAIVTTAAASIQASDLLSNLNMSDICMGPLPLLNPQRPSLSFSKAKQALLTR